METRVLEHAQVTKSLNHYEDGFTELRQNLTGSDCGRKEPPTSREGRSGREAAARSATSTLVTPKRCRWMASPRHRRPDRWDHRLLRHDSSGEAPPAVDRQHLSTSPDIDNRKALDAAHG